MALECLTRALRERRPELVREELVGMLIAGEEEWLRDERDLMVALAPFHHCAAQLQLNVPAVFDAAASWSPGLGVGQSAQLWCWPAHAMRAKTSAAPQAITTAAIWPRSSMRPVSRAVPKQPSRPPQAELKIARPLAALTALEVNVTELSR